MSTPRAVPEEFLHFVWENRLFFSDNLQTSESEPLEIVTTGRKNTDAGPDFFNAKIKIGDTLWPVTLKFTKERLIGKSTFMMKTKRMKM